MIKAAFAGNPNCGKTTLFNAYTGARLKVANWPGVTVEKKESRINLKSGSFNLVDLPGAYSLTCYTIEEKVARQYLLDGGTDVVINVVDASVLERSLYLTVQLIELGVPVVLTLNMMDVAEKRGIKIDVKHLSELLGVPVMPVSARKRQGLDELIQTAAEFRSNGRALKYSMEIEDKISAAISLLKKSYPELKNPRWYAIKLLESDAEIMSRYPLDLDGVADKSLEGEIIRQRYDYIEGVISEVLENRESTLTDKADKIFAGKYTGLPVFLLIMAAVFLLTFTLGDWLKGFFEGWVESFAFAVEELLLGSGASATVVSLVTDGVIAGVGGVISFLPNIFVLFLSLAFLEDSGYMARAAYVMDGMMSQLGLSGRAFIPMLLGFGCSVPAVMASRTLENERDRLRTMLVVPFMSCSARLPVYVLLSGMFFGKYAVIAAYSMYLIGVLVAAFILLVISKTDKTGRNDLLIELPDYRCPSVRTVAIYVWEKLSDYLHKAGTVIFAASVLLWVLLNFNMHGMTENMADSFAAMAGRVVSPVLAPAGLGYWQIAVALISGVAAKEVVVSSMGVLYGIQNAASPEGMSVLSGLLAGEGFGAVNAYSMMLFCLLYIPCAATLAAIRKESHSGRFTLGAVVLQLAAAWTVSTVFFQIAQLFV